MVMLERPPPFSTLSFKSEVLVGDDANPGSYESVLVPRLFEECAMAIDDRIVLVHYQDHGIRWTLANAFLNARANYGYARGYSTRGRREVCRFIVTRLALRQWQEAWASRAEFGGPADGLVSAAVCVCTAAGALTGVLAGAGRAGDKVA
jgi:hypothetical protein